MAHELRTGDPIYVPSEDVAIAVSLGAAFIEGDSRLRIPSPLPDGVSLADFERWTTDEARVSWLSETVALVLGDDIDLMGLMDAVEKDAGNKKNSVLLYVPRSEMDRARMIPGVRWSRDVGMYTSDESADFGLIFPYLTEGAKKVWRLERHITDEVGLLVKARALVAEREEEIFPHDPAEREIESQVNLDQRKENDH